MSCRLLQRHVGALVDGELDPATTIEFERHLDVCAPCQELVAFERRSRSFVRDSLGGVEAPESLRQRIRISLDAEPTPSAAPLVRVLPIHVRHLGAVAAAALVLIVVGSSVDGDRTTASLTGGRAAPVLEDVVRLHSSSLPADVQAAAPQQVSRYFQDKVAFPVRPARFERGDVRLVGARLSNVQEQRAAALYYDVHGARVTVVVFEGPEFGEEELHRVRFGGREVVYRDVHGYAVPLVADGDLYYAFTGDVDRRTLLELAASAHVAH